MVQAQESQGVLNPTKRRPLHQAPADDPDARRPGPWPAKKDPSTSQFVFRSPGMSGYKLRMQLWRTCSRLYGSRFFFFASEILICSQYARRLAQVQDVLESKLDKRRRGVLGPAAGRKSAAEHLSIRFRSHVHSVASQ